MSRLLLPNLFCAKCKYCTQLTARESPLLTLRARARVNSQPSDKRSVFIQHQQRRFVGGSSLTFSKSRSKSKLWICGVGAGIALALGLKYHNDTANSSCDDKATDVKRTGRYSAAIKVSRDLVERIKDEVGAPGLVVGVSVDGSEVWCEGWCLPG